jgi:hypothetical protein
VGGRGRGLEGKADIFLDNKWSLRKRCPICIHSNVNLRRQLRKFAYKVCKSLIRKFADLNTLLDLQTFRTLKIVVLWRKFAFLWGNG